MKKILYLSLAIAAMLATGCNKEIGNNPTPFDPATAGDGFLAFNVAMPTAAATKANDKFDDGTADEYRVEDIILLLFTGDTEETATLASAYNLSEQRTAFGTVGDPDDQITSTTSNAALVAQIKRSTLSGDKAFAFIILNDHQFVRVEPSKADLYASTRLFVQSNTDPHAGAALTDDTKLTGWTFSDFKKLALDESGRNFANASFLMSNAPVATAAASLSWNGELSTLVEFNKASIKPTRQAALDAPACTINVERALAKVTCNFASTGKLQNNDAISFKILGWDLDNYNLMGYITRNFNDKEIAGYNGEVDFAPTMKYLSQYYTVGAYGHRFSSPNPIAIDGTFDFNTNVFRTYWGQDVNYFAPADYKKDEKALTYGAPLVSRADSSLVIKELRGSGTSYYCPENTFDINHQTVRNTTRLVLAAELNNGEPFFTLQEHATTLYPDKANAPAGSIQKFLNDAIANRVNVRNWAASYIDGTIDQEGNWAEGLFTITFANELTDAQTGAEARAAVPGMKYALVAVNPEAALSKFIGTDDTAKAATRTAAIAAFAAENLAVLSQHYLANSYKLYYFDGGVAYYQALIKHFGDYETPWNSDPTMSNTIENIYGKDYADRDFLGRYGIVRNNWYQLSVDGIRNIGSSVVPPLTDVPDDSVENYLSVRINILPWALRVQDGIIL